MKAKNWCQGFSKTDRNFLLVWYQNVPHVKSNLTYQNVPHVKIIKPSNYLPPHHFNIKDL